MLGHFYPCLGTKQHYGNGMRSVTVRTGEGKFQQTITVGSHRLLGDEPVALGGDDAGPSPHEMLLAGLGSCTSMTIKMYADRKGWPLRSVEVQLSAERRDDAWVVKKLVQVSGELSEEQQKRLLEIGAKCPVHKTLIGEIKIESELS